MARVKNSLTQRRYYERINTETLNKLIAKLRDPKFSIARWGDKNTETIKEMIERLCLIKSRVSDGKLLVKYQHAGKLGGEPYGRVYAVRGLSIGGLKREIRATLAKEYYVDIDIVNCHPVIMEQLFDKYDLSSECLSAYNNNREKFLNDVMKVFNVCRDEAKRLFLRIMYNGTFDAFCKDNGVSDVDPECEIVKFINKFSEELRGNYEFIVKCPDFAELMGVLETCGIGSEYNELGSKMSWVLQDIECGLLTEMINYIKKNKLGVDSVVLCFDGFCILKENFEESLLRDLEEHIYNMSNLEIKLAVKEFEGIDLGAEVSTETSNEASNDKCFKRESLVSRCTDYKLAKSYFEQFYCYCKSTHNHIFIDVVNNGVCQVESKALKEEFAGVTVAGEFLNGKPAEFIQLWLKDPEKRVVEGLVYKAYSGPMSLEKAFDSEYLPALGHTKTFVNTFQGFSSLIGIDPESISVDARTTFETWFNDYFSKILLYLCENDTQCYDWVFKYFCQLIQKPNDRPGKALIFVSETQGAGKNSVLQAIARVIGEYHYNEAENLRQAYFADHAVGACEKLLVTGDEARAAGNFDLESALKNFITSPMITINKKFEKQYKIANLARLVVTSNNIDALPIDFRTEDRRYQCFLCDCSFIKSLSPAENKDFFDFFYRVINSEWFPCLMYEKMMSVDLSNWSENGLKLKVTKLKVMMQSLYKDTTVSFIEESFDEIISGVEHGPKDTSIEYKASDFYSMYLEFCKNDRRVVSKTRFGVDIPRLFDFIERKRSNGRSRYRIDITGYRAYLETLSDSECIL